MTDQQTPHDEKYMRCTICGFIVDTSYAATKPTADFTTRGRAKKGPEQQIDILKLREQLGHAGAAIDQLTKEREEYRTRWLASEVALRGDEVDPDDTGSLFITREKDGRVTVKVRSPQSTTESAISIPLKAWLELTSLDR